MLNYDLSVLIPARSEEFLQRTIEDVLKNSRGNTEVIVILDGYWPDEGIPVHERITIVHHKDSIGQRAATNEGAKISQANYIMKLDAHCSLDEGFDVKLMEDCEYDWTVLPRMYVLDSFHWICLSCGKEHDQGPARTSCDKCGEGAKFERKIIWDIKHRKKTDYMWIDSDLRIKYFDSIGLSPYGTDQHALKKKYSHKLRDWAQEEITDVMAGIGACWFMHRERYWELGGLDEGHGSWGQMAVEIACKSWLSGGRQVVNKKTWFAHLPRTQPGFSWPYNNPVSDQEKARSYSKNLWLNNNWEGQKYPFNWMIKKFGPLPGWDKIELDQKELSKKIVVVDEKKEPVFDNKTCSLPQKGLVYYTDNQCEERVANLVRKQLKNICNGNSIVSVSQYPINFGDNIVIREPRSILTMFKQILTGLEKIDADIIFLTEHDILYSEEHFRFTPPKKDVFYYDQNFWKLDAKTGQALFFYCKQTSGLCAYRDLLLEHYTNRVKRVEKEGFTRSIGFEPGTHKYPRGIDDYISEVYWASLPSIDIRHANNLTWSRWKKEQYRNQDSIKGWALSNEIPGWGRTKDRVDDFLQEIEQRISHAD